MAGRPARPSGTSRPRLVRAGAAIAAVLLALGLAGTAMPPGVRPRISGVLGLEGEAVITKLHRRLALAALGIATAVAGPTQAAGAVPPTQIGVNLARLRWWNTRVFANLVLGSQWELRPTGKAKLEKSDDDDDAPGDDAGNTDADGNLVRLPPNTTARRFLTRPDTGPGGGEFRCTYSGKGVVELRGRDLSQVVTRDGVITFRWINDWAQSRTIELVLRKTDPADPVRDLDCREAALPRSVRFDADFLAMARKFRVLRFMELQNTNGNPSVAWATRHTPRSLDLMRGDGVAVEDLVAITQQTGADPWFIVPWKADAEYVERFARYVHDHVPADRTVYVETSNEVWNWRFAVTKQADAEGKAHFPGMSGPLFLFRYAERLTEVMKIWTRVFADRPNRLVRVAASQNADASKGRNVLGFKDTARYVDALASAPYFTPSARALEGLGLDQIYAILPAALDDTLNRALANKAVAARYGKRYIAYEGGQHVVLKDVALERQIQRDPRMYDLYKRYLARWRAEIGDLVVLYASVNRISKSGGWGLLEHDKQPLGEAPKMRAVMEEIGR